METAFTTLPPLSGSREETRVPLIVGLEKFRIRTGIFLWAAGCIALGCIILAPKYDSSRASPKETAGRSLAFLTILGSAVINPSTSVHIQISSVLSAAPRRLAV